MSSALLTESCAANGCATCQHHLAHPVEKRPVAPNRALPVWRECTACAGAGMVAELGQTWKCSGCKGRGYLCDCLPRRFHT